MSSFSSTGTAVGGLSWAEPKRDGHHDFTDTVMGNHRPTGGRSVKNYETTPTAYASYVSKHITDDVSNFILQYGLEAARQDIISFGVTTMEDLLLLENADFLHFPIVLRRKLERGLKIVKSASDASPDKTASNNPFTKSWFGQDAELQASGRSGQSPFSSRSSSPSPMWNQFVSTLSPNTGVKTTATKPDPSNNPFELGNFSSNTLKVGDLSDNPFEVGNFDDQRPFTGTGIDCLTEENSSQAVLTNVSALQIKRPQPFEFAPDSGGEPVGYAFQRQQEFASASDVFGEFALPCEGAPSFIQRTPPVPAFGRAGLDPEIKLQMMDTSPNTGDAAHKQHGISSTATSLDVKSEDHNISPLSPNPSPTIDETRHPTASPASSGDFEDFNKVATEATIISGGQPKKLTSKSQNLGPDEFSHENICLEHNIDADTVRWAGELRMIVPGIDEQTIFKIVNHSLSHVDSAVSSTKARMELDFETIETEARVRKTADRQSAALTKSIMGDLENVNARLFDEREQMRSQLEEMTVSAKTYKDAVKSLNKNIVANSSERQRALDTAASIFDSERADLLEKLAISTAQYHSLLEENGPNPDHAGVDDDTNTSTRTERTDAKFIQARTKSKAMTLKDLARSSKTGDGATLVKQLANGTLKPAAKPIAKPTSVYDRNKSDMRDFFEARSTSRLLIAAASKNAYNMATLAIDEIGEENKDNYDAFRMGENIANGLQKKAAHELMELLANLDRTVLTKSPKAIHDLLPMANLPIITTNTDSMTIAKLGTLYVRDNLISMYPIYSDIVDIEASYDPTTGLFTKPRHCKSDGYSTIKDAEEREAYSLASAVFHSELVRSLSRQSSRLTTAETTVQYGSGKFSTTATNEDGVQLFFSLLCSILKDVRDIKQTMIKELTVCAEAQFGKFDPLEVVAALSDKVTEANNMLEGRPKIPFDQCIGTIALGLIFREANFDSYLKQWKHCPDAKYLEDAVPLIRQFYSDITLAVTSFRKIKTFNSKTFWARNAHAISLPDADDRKLISKYESAYSASTEDSDSDSDDNSSKTGKKVKFAAHQAHTPGHCRSKNCPGRKSGERNGNAISKSHLQWKADAKLCAQCFFDCVKTETDVPLLDGTVFKYVSKQGKGKSGGTDAQYKKYAKFCLKRFRQDSKPRRALVTRMQDLFGPNVSIPSLEGKDAAKSSNGDDSSVEDSLSRLQTLANNVREAQELHDTYESENSGKARSARSMQENIDRINSDESLRQSTQTELVRRQNELSDELLHVEAILGEKGYSMKPEGR